jgi:hypothetical protein
LGDIVSTTRVTGVVFTTEQRRWLKTQAEHLTGRWHGCFGIWCNAMEAENKAKPTPTA